MTPSTILERLELNWFCAWLFPWSMRWRWSFELCWDPAVHSGGVLPLLGNTECLKAWKQMWAASFHIWSAPVAPLPTVSKHNGTGNITVKSWPCTLLAPARSITKHMVKHPGQSLKSKGLFRVAKSKPSFFIQARATSYFVECREET